MKITFLSYWVHNPYQELLVKHLRKFGIEITEINEKSNFPIKILNRPIPDILHLQLTGGLYGNARSKLQKYWRSFMFITRLFIVRQKGIKIVCTIHENPNSKLDKINDKIIGKLCHRIIVLSSYVKTAFINELKLDQAKMSVIPQGNYIEHYENTVTRTTARRMLGISDANFVILFFGWLAPRKGLSELIEAFNSIRRDRTTLIIAGKAFDQNYLKFIEKKVKHSANIQLQSDFIPDDQIQLYMNACDIVVIPYKEFTISGVALLAMSFGKACIAPRSGFFNEVFDNENAFLYDPESKHGLSQAIAEAIKNEKILHGMGINNKSRAKRWDWGNIAGMTANVYQKLLR